jgi:hypothetical protein
MDKREMLKSMLNNLINDKSEEAQLDLHGYLTSKMKEVSGIAAPTETETVDDALDASVTVDDTETSGTGEV